ncbi:hypothetical protein Tco_0090790 [Tanacetum coccineum]
MVIRNELNNVVEEEDREWIRFLGGSSSSGTKKYRGSNSSDGGNTRDGVKIAGEVIGSGFRELKELLPKKLGNNTMRLKYRNNHEEHYCHSEQYYHPKLMNHIKRY